MARKKAKTSRKKSSSGLFGRWLGGISTDRRRNVSKGLGRIVTFAVLIALVVGGFRFLEKYVQAITKQRNVQLTVELADHPSWASEELVEQICLSSGVRSDDFLLDNTLAGKWTRNLRQNPWVKQIRQVRLRFDGRVVIDCQLREPIAAIEQDGEVCYIDMEGVVLPQLPVNTHLITLRGCRETLPAPGNSITSPSLIAGLEVLTLIRQVDSQLPRQERLWTELARLDVSNYEGQISRALPHINLYTRNNTEIRWGAAVGRERPYYEAQAQYKLANLYRAFNQFGTLDEYNFVELRDLRKERSDPLRNNS